MVIKLKQGWAIQIVRREQETHKEKMLPWNSEVKVCLGNKSATLDLHPRNFY